MLNQLFFLICLYTINSCKALPAEYCNYPFNSSDCGMEPTPVFAYYKPGSRCELQYWKGCPTLNKFRNELTCSYFCIARLMQSESTEENDISNEDSNSCDGSLNTEDCQKAPLLVYTYVPKEQHCIKQKWRGCETTNKFFTREACEKNCLVQKLSNIKFAENIIKNLMNNTEQVEIAEAVTEEAAEEKKVVEEEKPTTVEEGDNPIPAESLRKSTGIH